MKRFKVEKTILCEVNVWGYIDAEHMPDALIKVAQPFEVTTSNRDYDHEIISDIKTLSVEIKEESQ